MKNTPRLETKWNSLSDYNRSVALPSAIITGKEFRRLKREMTR